MKGQFKSYLENRKVTFRRHPKDYSLNAKSKFISLIQAQAEARLNPFSPYHISYETNNKTIQYLSNKMKERHAIIIFFKEWDHSIGLAKPNIC